MKYIKLNNTDLEVCPMCLGTSRFGSHRTVEESKAILSEYVKLGGNIIDTAQIYGDWLDEKGSFTERIVGEWLEETKNREKIVLITKAGHPALRNLTVPRVNAVEIRKDLEGSLKNLRTSYIDMYLLHRQCTPDLIPEVMECLEEARKEGKIHYYGCSNWSLENIKTAKVYCEANGLMGFVTNQLMWSLADVNYSGVPDNAYVTMDKATYEYHAETGMNAMGYSSIASGYFSKVYGNKEITESIAGLYNNESNNKILEIGKDMVEAGDYTFMDLSYLYFMKQERFPSVAVAAFSNVSQLQEAMASLEKDIDIAVIEQLEDAKVYVYK